MMRVIFFLSTVCLFSTCQPAGPPPPVSFYYWKTSFDLSPQERDALTHNGATKLYMRYFDVAMRGGQPVPVSPVRFAAPPPLTVVPVVYVKNEVMQYTSLNVNTLARQVATMVEKIDASQTLSAKEIQVDCDWTASTKDVYFAFLQALKQQTQKQITATIRLHQVKYWRRTGVPPVDHGVLMYYNMGRIGPDSLNSIYDRERARGYVSHLRTYPLKLDVALPVFTWGMQIRQGKVIALLNKVDAGTFSADTNFTQKAAPFFEVKHNVIKIGHYFERGDRVKIESITMPDLEEMAQDLSAAMDGKPGEIIFFDLDTFNLNHFRNEQNFYQDISGHF